MKFSARLRKGFTLIELLIVIVIIGILAVGLVPKVIDAPKKARDTVRKTDLNQIKTAAESYYADNNKYPAAATALADLKSYFQGGTTPVNVDASNPYTYLLGGANSCYVLYVKLESANSGNLAAAPAPADCPAVKALALTQGAGQYYVVPGGSY